MSEHAPSPPPPVDPVRRPPRRLAIREDSPLMSVATFFGSAIIFAGTIWLLILMHNRVGWAITVIAPIALGAVVAAMMRRAPGVLSAIAAVAGAFGLVVLFLAGTATLLCLVTAMASAVGGAVIGVHVAGSWNAWAPLALQRLGGWFLAALVLLPFPVHYFEFARGAEPLRRVVTSRTIAAQPASVWAAVRTYDEIATPPPWQFSLGLPRPLGTEGPLAEVGDVQRCRYTRGEVTKRLNIRAPESELTFEITRQEKLFKRSGRLARGSFLLAPAPGGATTLTLVSEYEPLLFPRAYWCWFEDWAGSALHEFILDDIERRALGTPPAPALAKRPR